MDDELVGTTEFARRHWPEESRSFQATISRFAQRGFLYGAIRTDKRGKTYRLHKIALPDSAANVQIVNTYLKTGVQPTQVADEIPKNTRKTHRAPQAGREKSRRKWSMLLRDELDRVEAGLPTEQMIAEVREERLRRIEDNRQR